MFFQPSNSLYVFLNSFSLLVLSLELNALCQNMFGSDSLLPPTSQPSPKVIDNIPGVPQKAERLILVTLIFENIAFLKFHQIKHCLLKRMISRSHWNWLSSFDSMVISQNMVIFHFLFILVTFQSGIMAFLTSIHCCPEAHWSVQTKQRENLWTAIPTVNSSRRFNKIRKWLCFKKWL